MFALNVNTCVDLCLLLLLVLLRVMADGYGSW
jgi:hypothetical protein